MTCDPRTVWRWTKFALVALTPLFAASLDGQATEPDGNLAEVYAERAERLIDAALADSAAFDRLAFLVDEFGPRLSGSENLERAIQWVLTELRADGLQNVRGEEVMVPHWVRGEESAELLEPRRKTLPMLALGGSVGTPVGGITAEVLVVNSFDELRARADEAAGRIVVYDVPFPQDVEAYEGYSRNVAYRLNGAIEAAKVGAVASLIRSITPYSMQTPHTGSMRYDPAVPRIPHAALTVEDAALLGRLQDRGQRIVIRLEMEAQTLPDAVSHNVIGELVGTERPDEIVVIGCHFDSWDVGDGSMDDAGGCIATWEAVRLMRELGLRPRRTVRLVLWTNEENGFRGREAYARAHESEFDDYVMALELDIGVFEPEAFGLTGTPEAMAAIRGVLPLLERTGVSEIYDGGGGPDIFPLMEAGVPSMSFHTDYSRYLWYHHSAADTIDKLDPLELAKSVAAVAVLTYVVADMPERLPRD